MIKILIADHGRACLYETARYGGPLLPLDVLINPAARLHERELGTDAPGRAFNRASGARQAYSQPDRFRSAAASTFARQICKLLDKSLRGGDCEGVVLVAAPSLLSELQHALPAAVRHKLLGHVGKDLVKHSTAHVAKQLRKAWESRNLMPAFLPMHA